MYFICFNLIGIVDGRATFEESWSQFLQNVHLLE